MFSRTSALIKKNSGQGLILLAIVAFLIGICVYLFGNIGYLNLTVVIVDIVAIVTLVVLIALMLKNMIGRSRVVMVFTVTVVVELGLSIIFESMNPRPDSVERVMLFVTLCFFPALLSKLTKGFVCQLIVAAAAIISYVVASFLLDCLIMYRLLPVYAAIHVFILILSKYLEPTAHGEKEDGRDIEPEHIDHLLKLEPDQWHLLKQSRLNQNDVQKIVNDMGRKMEDKIINEAKMLFHKEEQITSALKNMYPDLTMSELQICVLITQGKTVSEISYIRNVSPSTVTSTRCQLRKKLGLDKQEILQHHLRSVVYNACHSPDSGSRLFRMRSGRII